LKAAGATVHIVSLEPGVIKGWDKKDWGRPVKVDKTLNQVSADDYDAIVLPGGQINPDLLRVEAAALAFIKDFHSQKKIVAAVCHAPWLLIETGLAKGRKMTSYKSIKTDVKNAGATWEDSEVVFDKGVITSRHPRRPGWVQRHDHRRSQPRQTRATQRCLNTSRFRAERPSGRSLRPG
jgi:protease I